MIKSIYLDLLCGGRLIGMSLVFKSGSCVIIGGLESDRIYLKYRIKDE